MLSRVASQKLTDVSEVPIASITALIIIRVMMMDAVSTSETSANFYEATPRNTHKTAIFILATVRTRNLTQNTYFSYRKIGDNLNGCGNAKSVIFYIFQQLTNSQNCSAL
jgi:hypothetical protein